MFQDLYAGFQAETLDNGLSLYLKEWPSVSWFYVGIVVHGGAREDPPERAGLAHLLEHLVGENIEGLTFSQVKKRFEALGGQGWFGTTSYLASKYKFHFPDHVSAIQEALTLFGRMLLMGQLTHKIEEEKAVLVREYHRRYEHELARTWALQGRPVLFAHHPNLSSFACASGIPDQFLLSTPQELQTFYERYYVPHNISLVCMGSLSKQQQLDMIQQTPFAVQKPGQRNRMPAAFTPPVPQKQEQIVHLSEFSHFTPSQAAISLEWVLPLRFSRYAVRILSEMIETALREEIRYKRSLTYDVSVEYEYYQDCRTLRTGMEVAPEALQVALDLFWKVLGSMPQAQECFQAEKKAMLDCMYRMDYSGYDFLTAIMNDLEDHHRLISFSEEFHQVKQVSFDQIREIAEYLLSGQHFCFILQP